MASTGRNRKLLTRPRGFTLVELVAAASCVGLLLAIIQPSLQATLGQSRNAVCLDRLRAIGQANLAYSADDLDGWAIPVHGSFGVKEGEMSWPTLAARGRFVGAYEWGGKSGIGRDDFMGPSNPLNSAYGTKAGFGPATRPLNNILYPHGFRDNLDPVFSRVGATIDTQLKLEAYRCPADDGPPGGAHCPQWLDHPQRSSYDHFGTSYASNVFMNASQGGGEMRSNSPYLRPLSRVPNPARTLNYEENIGRWAWAARRELTGCEFVGGGVDPGPTKAVRGWHGKNWTFNRVFVDAHAETQPVYIEGTEDQDGYANHYRNQHLPAYPDWPGCGEAPDDDGSFTQYRCIIVRGPGWQKDTMPAELICTGLQWSGGGRPSYENCVSPGESAVGGSGAGIR
jgi:type II secretory pathway pseudopilin PulG